MDPGFPIPPQRAGGGGNIFTSRGFQFLGCLLLGLPQLRGVSIPPQTAGWGAQFFPPKGGNPGRRTKEPVKAGFNSPPRRVGGKNFWLSLINLGGHSLTGEICPWRVSNSPKLRKTRGLEGQKARRGFNFPPKAGWGGKQIFPQFGRRFLWETKNFLGNPGVKSPPKAGGGHNFFNQTGEPLFIGFHPSRG